MKIHERDRKGGIESRLIRYAVLFVLLTGAALFLASCVEFMRLKSQIGREDESQSELLKDQSRRTLSANTKDSLLQMTIWAADKTDDEFWIMEHDIRVLADQAEAVFTSPDRYEPLPVNPPREENGGKYVLQLLLPEGVREPDSDALAMAGRLANLAPMMEEIIRGNEGYTMDCYISTPDGLTLAMDEISDEKVDKDGSPVPYDARKRPWYKGALKAKGVCFSPAVHSYFYDFNEVVFSVPVYVEEEPVAVIAGSSRLSSLQKILGERNIGHDGFSILIGKNGQLVYSPRAVGELAMDADLSADVRDKVGSNLKKFINKALDGKTDVTAISVDGETYFAACAPVPTPGWTQIAFASAKEAMAPSEVLLKGMDASSDKTIKSHMKDFRHMAVVMAGVLLLVMCLAVLLIRAVAKREVIPLEQMTQKVRAFTENDMTFVMEDVFCTGDEIEVLARSFETMSETIKGHVEHLVEMKTEQERRDAELSVAAQIQESMLPGKHPDRKEFQIFASMTPAKDVGGDFYDFFMIDEDHLALLIADVSGKGITAAMFMAQAMQELRAELLIHGEDVAVAVSAANQTLYERSVRDMFVTAWVGVLNIPESRLTYVNAGHEYAVISRAGSDFTIEKDDHSMAAAALKRAKFRVNETNLSPGDTFYLYTDGVTEARNDKKEMFGTERLTNALNEAHGLLPGEIDQNVRQKIAEFVGDAEQFDDITTLCFRYLGTSIR